MNNYLTTFTLSFLLKNNKHIAVDEFKKCIYNVNEYFDENKNATWHSFSKNANGGMCNNTLCYYIINYVCLGVDKSDIIETCHKYVNSHGLNAIVELISSDLYLPNPRYPEYNPSYWKKSRFSVKSIMNFTW